MSEDLHRRIKELEDRVRTLEKNAQQVNAYTRGCVCPAGAEMGCNSVGCPRRGIPTPTWY